MTIVLLVISTTVQTNAEMITENETYSEVIVEGEKVSFIYKGMEEGAQAKKKTQTIEIYKNDQLDQRLYVNVSEDRVVIEYVDGTRIERAISDIVRVTPSENYKALPADIKHVRQKENSISLMAVDYLGNEPFEVSSSGTQVKLGNPEYDGYELVGSRSYSNPTESAYLQRRGMGRTAIFEEYNFSIDAGEAVNTAAGIIGAIVGAASAAALFASLIWELASVSYGVITTIFEGKIRCDEFLWNYRVRHNSNTGTILTTTYKYKYFWRMYNSRTGVAEYGYRNDLQDGWILSNVELLNVALGRA